MLTESSEQAGGYSMQELEQVCVNSERRWLSWVSSLAASTPDLLNPHSLVKEEKPAQRVLSSFPENITEETRSSVENRASSTKDSSPSNELSTKANAMNQPRNAPSQQQASTSSAMAGRQGPAATTNSKTLEEMKKRTQRLELMMEMMLEDNMNNGNMSNPSSTSRQRLERHESLKVIPDEVTSADEKSAPDINYANWTGFLPLENILEPDMVRWAHPLESLGLEENWSRVCDVTTPGQHLFTNIQRRLINIVAERNISTATQVRPTEQRIIATLIMSNLPPNLPSDRLQPAEYQTAPLMALSMAQHLELDVALYLPYDAPFTGWPLADTEAVLEELCLYFASGSMEQLAFLSNVQNVASARLPSTTSLLAAFTFHRLQFTVDFAMVEKPVQRIRNSGTRATYR
ncbi:hypothetical protein QFC19_001673 [Naganishia cerealis]|uniref:Uncharacterized protein n=1 Tax=Naganishia cerealis TaxID=610337 RepID=A0ACC2WG26_9TREE|nr:hypothetical protein QFC19_001673 [Naganishia cerealis]